MESLDVLTERIEGLIAECGSPSVSVSYVELTSARQLHIRAGIPYHPASTFKTCVMMEAYRQAKSGQLSLEDELPVVNSFISIADGKEFSVDVDDDSDAPLYELIGQLLPLSNLIERMIVVSSNLATNILMERLGVANVSAFMKELGVHDLVIRRGVDDKRAYRLGMNNSATSRSLAEILIPLAKGKAVSEEASKEMVEVLLRQEFNEGIPALLPEGTRVAHKTGWDTAIYHDMAIVYPVEGDPYVLAVMTRGDIEAEKAQALVANISRVVYYSREL